MSIKSEDIEIRLYMLEALTMALASTHPDAEALTAAFDKAVKRIQGFMEGNNMAPEVIQRVAGAAERIRVQIEPE
ncbi:hypothetical protein [Derxia lacustris]|uniref:hypothetical protein n=1 Tax=Derxia lacustris TaxID=764842 RepID=UPI000A177AE9|nr:hypothetical protein [Derxia lacustris]